MLVDQLAMGADSKSASVTSTGLSDGFLFSGKPHRKLAIGGAWSIALKTGGSDSR